MMKKTLFLIFFLSIFLFRNVYSQEKSDTTIYLLTCGQGIETYSHYGHSALRVVIPSLNVDYTYNWGIFDFEAPNFAWKFAKGRLDYMIGGQKTKSFLDDYTLEQRYVISQQINLLPAEKTKIIELINTNMEPQNRRYRYDFFYDNCSTRIRDIIEKAIGDNLRYPLPETGPLPTFRNLIGKYEAPYPWLRFGIDLLVGSPADKKANFRDRMFLPVVMKDELSKSVVSRSGKMIPLLRNPETLVDFPVPDVKPGYFTSPPIVFTLLCIVIMLITGLVKSQKALRIIDIVIFSVFTVLAVMIFFFNFFTDHIQLRANLNIIWLNPLIAVCLLMLIINKPGLIWFRLVFFISAFFILLHFILPQEFEISYYPLAFVLLVRSSMRSDFSWNPLTKS